MKKIYTLCMGILCISQINAQFKAGQKLVGPSLGIGYNEDETKEANGSITNKSNYLGLSFGISSIKMKNTNKGFGFGINYGYNKNKLTSSSTPITKTTVHSIAMSVFNRNFIPIKGRWNFYYDSGVYGSLRFSKGKNVYATATENQKWNTYTASLFLNPGFTYQLKKNILLDGSFNNFLTGSLVHERNKREDSNGWKQNQIRTFFNANSTLNSSDFFRNITISIRWVI